MARPATEGRTIQTVYVRGVRIAAWLAFRLMAAQRGMTIQDALEEATEQWIERES